MASNNAEPVWVEFDSAPDVQLRVSGKNLIMERLIDSRNLVWGRILLPKPHLQEILAGLRCVCEQTEAAHTRLAYGYHEDAVHGYLHATVETVHGLRVTGVAGYITLSTDRSRRPMQALGSADRDSGNYHRPFYIAIPFREASKLFDAIESLRPAMEEGAPINLKEEE